MCSPETEDKMIPGELIEALVMSLVKNYLVGLQVSTAEGTESKT